LAGILWPGVEHRQRGHSREAVVGGREAGVVGERADRLAVVVPLDVGVRRALAHTLEEGPLIWLHGLVLDVAHDLGLRRYHWQR